MRMERVADKYIEDRQSGGLAAVYRFLLRGLGDERRARREFIRYLCGDLSPEMVQLARRDVDTHRQAVNHRRDDDEAGARKFERDQRI